MNGKVKFKLLGIKAITSLHVGAGRGLGHIDLPVAREKATNYPYLPGSALKGVIRDYLENQGLDNSELAKAFGKKENSANEMSAGSLIFTDARLLALPIRSFFGTFAAVSCPMIINRLYEDFKAFYNKIEVPMWDFSLPDENIVVASNSPLVKDEKVYLEDVDFEVVKSDTNKAQDDINALVGCLEKNFSIFKGTELAKRFALVSDDAFAFLCETCTEVNAHIKIDHKTGIVQDGALWYQESLPPETFLYSFVFCDKVYNSKDDKKNEAKSVLEPQDLLNVFGKEPYYLQFGGKASTGLGRCQCRFEEA